MSDVTVHELHSFQAVCERCGWHTREFTSAAQVKRLAGLHKPVCPNPKPPRSGAVMGCGCWWAASPGSVAGRTTAECPLHGRTLMIRSNADEPVGDVSSPHWIAPPAVGVRSTEPESEIAP